MPASYDLLFAMEVDVHTAGALAVMASTIEDERRPSFERVALLACDAAEAVREAWRTAVASATTK